eukprot:3369229-Rhodomonas_salina.2
MLKLETVSERVQTRSDTAVVCSADPGPADWKTIEFCKLCSQYRSEAEKLQYELCVADGNALLHSEVLHERQLE